MRHDPAHRELDRELTARLRTFVAPVTLARAFDDLVPAWALVALDRLVIAGAVRELADGRIEIVAAR